MGFDPAKYPNALRLRDIANARMRLEVHCHECGRCRRFDPRALPIHDDKYVPALEGRFKCTSCGSRKTTARPERNRRTEEVEGGGPHLAYGALGHVAAGRGK